MKTNSTAWDALEFRCIGPPRGGRVVAVAGHPTQKNVFYFGGVAGGVWKTVDGGHYWENITDGQFDVSSVGALAVSEADPNVIYAGNRRVDDPAGRKLGRWGLQVDRWRRDLEERRTAGQSSYWRDPRSPPESRRRLRCRAGPRLWAERRAGRLPLHRRRRDVGMCSSCQRQGRRGRPYSGCHQPPHHLCFNLAGVPQLLGVGQRRPRQRALEVDRRR